MYKPGTRFEVKIKIVQGSTVVEPGTRGEIVEGIDKMVGKSYKVNLDDGRTIQIHIVVMNNQTKVLTDD